MNIKGGGKIGGKYMTKEEQEAIDEIKSKFVYLKNSSIPDYKLIFAIEEVLSLIDKQQKEIEELKEANKQQMLFTFKNNDLESVELVDNSYISKDKIRDKIKELEDFKKGEEKFKSEFGTQTLAWGTADYIITYLQELLEEE